MALQTGQTKKTQIQRVLWVYSTSVFVSYSKVKYYFNELSSVWLSAATKWDLRWSTWIKEEEEDEEGSSSKKKKKNKYLFSNAAASDRQKVNNVTFNHRQMPSVCQVALCHGITNFLLCCCCCCCAISVPDRHHTYADAGRICLSACLSGQPPKGSTAFPGPI